MTAEEKERKTMKKSESEGNDCYHNTKFLRESWIFFVIHFSIQNCLARKTCESNYTNTYNLALFIYISSSASLFGSYTTGR